MGLTLTVQPDDRSEPEEGGSVANLNTEQVRDLEYVNFRGGGYWYLGTFSSASITAGTPIVGGGTVVSTDIPFSDFVPGTFMVSGDYFDMTYRVLPYVAPKPEPEPVASNPALSVQTPKRFRATRVGRSSRAQRVRVRNIGDVPVTGISVAVTGAMAKDFAVSQVSPRRLLPGRSASFRATFKPSATGVRRATVVVRSSSRARTAPLTGTGTGIATPPAGPLLPFLR